MKDLLVLRLSALGDVIHTIPAVMAVRDAIPAWRVAWAVEEPYRELVEIVTGAEAIPVRMRRWGRHPIASRSRASEAFSAMRGSTVSADFQGLVKSAVLGRLSGARHRYGFDRGAVREKASLFFTNRRVTVDTTAHVVEQNLELASAVVAGETRCAITAPEPAALRRAFGGFAADAGDRLGELAGAVVLLPGAGRENKLWPVERFRAIAQHIGKRAAVVWGPGERDLAEAIGARTSPPTDLRELARVLRQASLVIGADTGPLHLAAALGTPVIGLYGPTDPRRNGPHGQVHRCVERFTTTKLMRSISVEDVVQTLERVESECI